MWTSISDSAARNGCVPRLIYSFWRYIYSWPMLYYITVTCLLSILGNDMYIVFFCNAMATLKPTKTRRIMLRCNTCNALIFANGIISQQRIQTLRDFVFRPLLWLLFQWSALNASKFDDHHWHIVCWCIHIDYQLLVLTLVTMHILVSPSFMLPTQSGEKLTVPDVQYLS